MKSKDRTIKGLVIAVTAIAIVLIALIHQRPADHWKFLDGRSPSQTHMYRAQEFLGETFEERDYLFKESSREVIARAKVELAAEGYKQAPASAADDASWWNRNKYHVLIKSPSPGSTSVSVLEPVPDDWIYKVRNMLDKKT